MQTRNDAVKDQPTDRAAETESYMLSVTRGRKLLPKIELP